jgi:hypothetical protein
MSRLQKIEDVENPQVGKFYLVPCVERFLSLGGGRFWPVIGTWHEDADIGVENHHYHYDWRFFSDKDFNSPRARGSSYFEDTAYNLGKVLTPSDSDKDHPPEIVWRRKKMNRQMPEFPILNYDGTRTKIAVKLEAEFKSVKMKCMTCPHRGMSLKRLPVAPDGTVVCNGHGLKWNIKTGAMVER